MQVRDLRIRKLRVDALCWTAFQFPVPSVGLLYWLTSLQIRLTVRFDGLTGHDDDFETTYAPVGAQQGLAKGHLRAFLMELPNLESLRLDLEDHLELSYHRWAAPCTLNDVFSADYVWPRLRKLTLRYFDATSQGLCSLLTRHSSTLKDLRLHNVLLERNPALDFPLSAWLEVFGTIRETLHLEHAALSGWLGTEDQMEQWAHSSYDNIDVWDLDADPELAAATARYLVHGGECPLNKDNVISRQAAGTGYSSSNES